MIECFRIRGDQYPENMCLSRLMIPGKGLLRNPDQTNKYSPMVREIGVI